MLMIIFVHSGISSADAELPMPELASEVIFYISDTFSRIAVPAFFLISGFLFFYNKDVNEPHFYRGQFKKRVRSLLMPYLLWNFMAMALKWMMTLPFMSFISPGMTGVRFGLMDFINAFGPFNLVPDHGFLGNYDPASTPADVPLWFIRDLLFIMLFTPLLYRMLKGKKGIVLCTALLFLFLCDIWPTVCFWFDMTGVCFFCFGAFLSINRYVPFAATEKHTGVVLVVITAVYVLVSVLRVAYRSQPATMPLLAVSIVVGVPCFLLVCILMAKSGVRVNRFLLNATFFIYASHWLTRLIVIKSVFYILKPCGSVAYIAVYFLVAFLITAVSLILYGIMSMMAPRFTAVLSGMRTTR